MIFWASAFLLGFLGSFHCAVMCGPLVVAVAQRDKTSNLFHTIVKPLVYNSGRIITYMILGAVVGLLGKGMMISGLQQFVSILSGVVLLAIYFVPRWSKKSPALHSIFGKLTSSLRKNIQPYFKTPTTYARFVMGMINGLLPCGLVYVAAAAALATGSPVYGLLYMLSFGVGTLPMLLAIHFSSQKIGPIIGAKMQSAIPYLVVCMSLVFILRGMNLGIKYLSPQITPQETSFNIPICH